MILEKAFKLSPMPESIDEAVFIIDQRKADFAF